MIIYNSDESVCSTDECIDIEFKKSILNTLFNESDIITVSEISECFVDITSQPRKCYYNDSPYYTDGGNTAETFCKLV